MVSIFIVLALFLSVFQRNNSGYSFCSEYGGDGGHRPRVEKGMSYNSTVYSSILIYLRIENEQKALK